MRSGVIGVLMEESRGDLKGGGSLIKGIMFLYCKSMALYKSSTADLWCWPYMVTQVAHFVFSNLKHSGFTVFCMHYNDYYQIVFHIFLLKIMLASNFTKN